MKAQKRGLGRPSYLALSQFLKSDCTQSKAVFGQKTVTCILNNILSHKSLTTRSDQFLLPFC